MTTVDAPLAAPLKPRFWYSSELEESTEENIFVPMLLSPACKDYLWGGTRLKSEYNKKSNLDPLAESWECSVHPDGPSIVASGIFEGLSLDRVLTEHPEFVGVKKRGTLGSLPILLKLIDAKKDLSVQVHPNDEFARQIEHQNGKTEMWYVLEAEEGARLVCGFAHDVTPKLLGDAIAHGKLSRHLRWVNVHKGDVFYVPSGTVHALGAGVVVAEIQESSNVTYRVYDYDRVDSHGQKRQLHFDKAMQVLNMHAGVDVRQKPRKISFSPGCAREQLCRCQYFEAEHILVSLSCVVTVTNVSFQVLLCLEGEGGIETETLTKPIRFQKGNCIFIPAGAGKCYLTGRTELLKIRC